MHRTDPSASTPMISPRLLHLSAVASLLALIILGLAWELWLAPLRPGGSWLALKVVPLLIPLRGVLRRNVYTLQWTSMLILLFFIEGSVRAATDRGLSATLGWVEVALVVVYFLAVITYLRPYKQAARARMASHESAH